MAAAIPAQAVGFGRIAVNPTLGQPLRLDIPVRLDSGERLEAGCVTAEVKAGDLNFPADDVKVQTLWAEGATEGIVRIRTVSSILEPVIQVAVSVGCEQRFFRRMTAFVDPPTVRPAVMAPPVLAGMDLSNGRATAPSKAAAGRPTPDAADTLLAAAGTSADAAPASRGATKPKRRTDKTRMPSSKVAGAADAMPPAAKAPKAAAKPGTTTARKTPPAAPEQTHAADLIAAAAPESTTEAPASARAPTGGRLLLDATPPSLKLDWELSAETAQAAAAGVPTGEEALKLAMDAGDDLAKLMLLEKQVAKLKRDAERGEQETAALRAQLAEKNTGTDLMPWAGGAAAVLALLTGGLLWQRRRRQGAAGAAASPWWTTRSEPAPGILEAQADPLTGESTTEAGSFETDPGALDEQLRPRDEVSARSSELAQDEFRQSWPQPEAPTEPANLAAAALHAGARDDGYAFVTMAGAAAFAGRETPVREVSVEELLDLDQQAEFFIALGQDEAAIELLMSHLRETGGLSPIPYVKLLEIYRRQGDREAFDRTRQRFNKRFNAYAPDWDEPANEGRALEDYDEAMRVLAEVWNSRVDAMAALEAMLFRKDRSQEMFDLNAYEDVTLLYSMARDLWQHDGDALDAVDVLLPLGDARSTTPAEFVPPHFDQEPPDHGWTSTRFESAAQVDSEFPDLMLIDDPQVEDKR